jgi:hypothetical protein
LSAVAKEVGGVIAIAMGVLAGRKEGSSWPMFFFVCFYLAYCGLSLCLALYSAGVDALLVVFVEEPDRFAQENQIVFLRLLRTTETALR